MTRAELDVGRKKAREVINHLAGWRAKMITDSMIEHVVQDVIEAVDDYRKQKGSKK